MTESLDAAETGRTVHPLGRYLVLARLGEGGADRPAHAVPVGEEHPAD